MKCAIDDYHHLTPGTTKRIKSKLSKDDDEGISTELDDQSTHFELGFQILKVFGKEEYKGRIIEYDLKNRLYNVEYNIILILDF